MFETKQCFLGDWAEVGSSPQTVGNMQCAFLLPSYKGITVTLRTLCWKYFLSGGASLLSMERCWLVCACGELPRRWGSGLPTGLVSVIIYTLAMESSVIFVIGMCHVSKQQMTDWVNVEKAGRAWGSCKGWSTQLWKSI